MALENKGKVAGAERTPDPVVFPPNIANIQNLKIGREVTWEGGEMFDEKIHKYGKEFYGRKMDRLGIT
ncbi:hypothetical protein [Verrucomicrobium sp. GAS474]|uniref:hypothetical protein n=1 Tax=Verrucomicrobium sp. GAS474 TaxID=1882831 RepID=UPI0012FFBFC8|nr:hypothetical protein [Verrucomicrobium sp. GAS474]